MKILLLLIKWVSNDTLLLYIELYEYLEDFFFSDFARNSEYLYTIEYSKNNKYSDNLFLDAELSENSNKNEYS